MAKTLYQVTQDVADLKWEAQKDRIDFSLAHSEHRYEITQLQQSIQALTKLVEVLSSNANSPAANSECASVLPTPLVDSERLATVSVGAADIDSVMSGVDGLMLPSAADFH